jgi:hypothetical protein
MTKGRAVSIHRIVYVSRSRLTGSAADQERQTRRILASARTNNRRAHVTGALSFNEGFFAQALEGSIHDLSPIFERIRGDSRHSNLKLLEHVQVERRLFPTWSMAYVNTPTGQERHPLAHFSFESALTDGAAPETEQLLLILRLNILALSQPTAT